MRTFKNVVFVFATVNACGGVAAPSKETTVQHAPMYAEPDVTLAEADAGVGNGDVWSDNDSDDGMRVNSRTASPETVRDIASLQFHIHRHPLHRGHERATASASGAYGLWVTIREEMSYVYGLVSLGTRVKDVRLDIFKHSAEDDGAIGEINKASSHETFDDYHPVCFSGDGTALVVLKRSTNTLHVFAASNRNKGNKGVLVLVTGAVNPTVRISHDGSVIAVHHGGKLEIYYRTEASLDNEYDYRLGVTVDTNLAQPSVMEMAANGSRIAMYGAEIDELVVYDVPNRGGATITPTIVHAAPANLAMSRDATAFTLYDSKDKAYKTYAREGSGWIESARVNVANWDTLREMAYAGSTNTVIALTADSHLLFLDTGRRGIRVIGKYSMDGAISVTPLTDGQHALVSVQSAKSEPLELVRIKWEGLECVGVAPRDDDSLDGTADTERMSESGVLVDWRDVASRTASVPSPRVSIVASNDDRSSDTSENGGSLAVSPPVDTDLHVTVGASGDRPSHQTHPDVTSTGVPSEALTPAPPPARRRCPECGGPEH